MNDVTIIGAGVAGMTAALRLAERGYKVTIYEQSPFVGGKYRATKWQARNSDKFAYHEHSYHMYLNWYHNFWDIAEEIGAGGNFEPWTKVRFLGKGDFPRMTELDNFGSLTTVFKNLFSGVIPPQHMFLYMYSIIDLLSTPMHRDRFRDLISVNGFVSTKPYSTDISASMYDRYLAKTFAVASYRTSAKTFQTFLEYGAFEPTPLYYLTNGNSFSKFLQPLETKLDEKGVTIIKNATVTDIRIGESGRVERMSYVDSPHDFFSADITLQEWIDQDAGSTPRKHVEIKGSLIFAIPPGNLSTFIGSDVYRENPQLGEASKLRSEPMTSLHLHFNKKFQDRLHKMKVKHLPPEPVILVDSEYKMSFIDNSRTWADTDLPYLNVVASDSRPLDELDAPKIFTHDRDDTNNKRHSKPEINPGNPRTAVDFVLHELRDYIYFETDEVDIELLEIDRNVGRELFINEVGTWPSRPETCSRIENLFLAGDFCKTPIDVVSLEAATVSGLQAAEEIRKYHGHGPRVRIKTPKKYPHALYWPWKLMLAPYAAAARMWAYMDEINEQIKRDD